MEETFAALTKLLSDVILPNLNSVRQSQTHQAAANDRIEEAIEELRLHIESQFAYIAAQLTACRAEMAATQALLKAVQEQGGRLKPDGSTLIH